MKFATTTQKLAKKLGLSKVLSIDQLSSKIAVFEMQDQQLVLHLTLEDKPDLLKFDLAHGEVAIRAAKASKSNEVVAKAIGCKSFYRPKVLDATAGMGRDALMMAMLGCNVVMQERNFAIYHLLENALTRLKQSPDFKTEVTQRLSLYQQNSIDSFEASDVLQDFDFLDDTDVLRDTDVLKDINVLEDIDVIYLDPMFPERKKSALVKKEMRLFKLLAGEDLDSDQLLLNGLSCSVKRVVVKRPKGAPVLAGKKPSHEILAKKFRYDVYLK